MRNKVSNRIKNKKCGIKVYVPQEKNTSESIFNLDTKKSKHPNSLLVNTNCQRYNEKQKFKCKRYNTNPYQLTRSTVYHRRLNKILPSSNNSDDIIHKNPFRKTLRRQRAEEVHVYGEHSCRILFKRRPESIVRAWFIRDMIFRFKEILNWLAKNHKAYRIVNTLELSKIAGTRHHGGVCFLIKKRNGIAVHQWANRDSTDDCIIALENIGNPHNLGAIIRNCAHFNIEGILLQDISLLESGPAIRIAEGGSEYIQPIIEKNIAEACRYLQKFGYVIITTSSHKGSSLFEVILPRKIVLVLGQESKGLSETMLSLSDLTISIDGTGNIESLNVSVATGILLSEWWRQQRKRI